MKEFTEAEITDIQGHIFRDVQKAERAALHTFANAVLAKYGSAPDERAIIERERKAWDGAVDYVIRKLWETPERLRENVHPANIVFAIERDRRYPLPKPIDVLHINGKPATDCSRDELLDALLESAKIMNRMRP